MGTTSRSDLKRLRDDIHSLDHSVHQDILDQIPPAIVSRNCNGAFFDMCQLDEASLKNIVSVVRYAKAVRGKLEDHDRKMFESAQQLVSGPVETDAGCTQSKASGAEEECKSVFNTCDGEEAFCTKMETGCITKPAKGVFVKKRS